MRVSYSVIDIVLVIEVFVMFMFYWKSYFLDEFDGVVSCFFVDEISYYYLGLILFRRKMKFVCGMWFCLVFLVIIGVSLGFVLLMFYIFVVE